jgi:hypothetical protein
MATLIITRSQERGDYTYISGSVDEGSAGTLIYGARVLTSDLVGKSLPAQMAIIAGLLRPERRIAAAAADPEYVGASLTV